MAVLICVVVSNLSCTCHICEGDKKWCVLSSESGLLARGEHSTEILLNALPATKVLPLSTLTAASMVIAELSSEV